MAVGVGAWGEEVTAASATVLAASADAARVVCAVAAAAAAVCAAVAAAAAVGSFAADTAGAAAADASPVFTLAAAVVPAAAACGEEAALAPPAATGAATGGAEFDGATGASGGDAGCWDGGAAWGGGAPLPLAGKSPPPAWAASTADALLCAGLFASAAFKVPAKSRPPLLLCSAALGAVLTDVALNAGGSMMSGARKLGMVGFMPKLKQAACQHHPRCVIRKGPKVQWFLAAGAT
jgi:hypothetical protein